MGNTMSNNVGGKSSGAAHEDTSGCRADDLRGLLERITRQISESEQRQSETLSNMLGRLEALGSEARTYKGKVPAAFLPAFERIEDGVSMLAERISAVRADAMPTITVTTPAAAPSVAEPRERAPLAGAPAAPAAASEPAAPAAPAFTASAPIYDYDAIIPNDENAWDREAADALARHYEAQVSGFDGPTPDPERAPAKARPGTREEARARGLDIERSWLEDRFADIARRVESSLADMAPDPAISTLGSRFDKLEQRFGSALDSVATRSDVEGLRILEAHITELTQQFDETRSQLGRLDGIEQTLSAVVDRLTDPRFDDILARGGMASDTDIEPLISAAVEQIASRLKESTDGAAPDFAGIANAAAERVATRFADINQADPAAGGEMTAIRQLLEHLISERREGDEQTAAMLDTMQQAMIRMLDRVDNLEVAQTKSTPQEYVREQVRFGVDAASGAASGAHKAADAASAFAAEARGSVNYEPRKPVAHDTQEAELPARPFVAETQSGVSRMSSAAPGPTPIPQPAPAAPGPASATNRSTGATVERLRQDFIADAQRAKLKAAAAATAGEAAATAAADAAGPARATRAPSAAGAAVPIGTARARKEEAAAGQRRSLPMPSRKILVSALVLLVAIPGIIMLVQKRAAKTAAAPASRIEAPVASEKMSATPAVGAPAAESAIERTPASEFGKKPTLEPAAARSADDAPAAGLNSEEADKTSQEESREDAPANEPADREDNRRDLPRANVDQLSQATVPAQPAETAVTGPAGIVAPPALAEAVPAPRLAASDRPAMPQPPTGIHVATPGKAPTLEQLQRLQQRQSMAEMSSKLGAAQPANPTLAALIPDPLAAAAGMPIPDIVSGGAMTPVAAAATTGMVTRKALDMPPAAIGPTSLRLAAANADASAEFEVGARFAEGNGIEQNFVEAARWYQRSATQGFAQAQYRLATLYERGLGVKQDLARAKVWYGRAAEGGNIKAMHNLAVLSAGRAAKTPDYATAATWFQAAAERGLADSQFNLAVLYEGGLGVAKQQQTAYKWFALAARAGDAEAIKRRDEMERSMPAEQLTEARRTVAAWVAKSAEKIANDARAAGEDWKTRARASGAI